MVECKSAECTSAETKRVYLAGPTVFRADTRARFTALLTICQQFGLAGIIPSEGVPVTREKPDPARTAAILFADNCDRIAQAHAVVADITPFRGPHMDCGTAFELGIAQARGLPLFCWSADRRPIVQRVQPANGGTTDLRDRNGMLIEDFGLVENLMITIPAGRIYASAAAAIEAAADALRCG